MSESLSVQFPSMWVSVRVSIGPVSIHVGVGQGVGRLHQ